MSSEVSCTILGKDEMCWEKNIVEVVYLQNEVFYWLPAMHEQVLTLSGEVDKVCS